ncbi:hypothetical protein L227DRAFT_575072 [Lentinus tigrinus ALCF2SS1-6]|uniref:F-box domain-containing protein n=1 Tax=Lentinus tigrinus ALCF2SS1-6 TaxID=1328759 RepID=A0A5C2SB01_9APHY|nr:hypothetical protein L227DRAFT_575072 [Lentinus tigrinus ALCF2SS1-6]
MDVSSNVLEACIRKGSPPPPLTALSIRLRVTQLKRVCQLLTHFGQTLRRLRIQISFLLVFSKSPAQTCMLLDLPNLEYLEIHDGPGSLPNLAQKVLLANISCCESATKGTPRLRSLVWAPQRGDSPNEDFLPGGKRHEIIATLRRDLFPSMKLKTLTILLARDQCIQFRSCDEGSQYSIVPKTSLTDIDWTCC